MCDRFGEVFRKEKAEIIGSLETLIRFLAFKAIITGSWPTRETNQRKPLAIISCKTAHKYRLPWNRRKRKRKGEEGFLIAERNTMASMFYLI
jgi:hypothetical protein